MEADRSRRITFHVYSEKSGKEVCAIHYTETIFNEEAVLEEIDSNDLPLDIKFSVKNTRSLLAFLKDRVLPPNRMGLEEQLRPLGISPNDWIRKMELNNGKTYTDKYYIKIQHHKADDKQSRQGESGG